VNAVNTQNLTLPAGTAKIGDMQYVVQTNATPATIDDLNNIPIRVVNGATVFVKDVGQVHDGWLVQQNVVRENGRRSVLLSIIKNGNASTLSVVNAVHSALQTARAAAPPGMQINELFDQSVFVKQSVTGVLREGAIAAALTALMILLFLGSWRSTVVVMISIPLAILTSLIVLYFLGETLNTMTLGGLALAVGILVDDSTVTIENTHRLLTEEGQPLPQATLHGAAGIAVPTLVSTLAISCVFTSVVFLDGPAKYLFTPLGLAVVFAMLASYGLSRTLTPITIGLLLKNEHHGPADAASAGLFARFHAAFERRFEAMRHAYSRLLRELLNHPFIIPVVVVVVLVLGGVMFPLVGRDFFPAIDGGQIQLHVRAPAGTRIESTERNFQAVEDKIREIIPESERELVVDNIGLPARSYNLAFADGSTIGVNDGVILVSLKEGHAPTSEYVRKLRRALPAAFPEDTFYFQAADMVTQILDFGLPAQIDVRTVGYDKANDLRVARELRRRIAAIPGIVDAHLQQEVDAPAFYANIDRTRAAQLGLNANSIATNVNVSLSSSEQVTPNFWTDPKSGIPYYLAVQTPENRISSLSDLGNTPVSTSLSSFLTEVPVPGLLSNVATLKRGRIPTNGNQQDRGGHAKAAQAGKHHPGDRPDREHERGVSRSRHRPAVCRGVCLSADGRELSEFRRSIRGNPGLAGDAVRHPHHVVRDQHHAQCALPDGRDHGSRRRFGELHSAGDVRAGTTACGQDRLRGCHRGGAYADPAGADDRGRHDRRDDSDGDRRGRRRAKRRLGARGYRRPSFCDADHAAGGAVSVRDAAQRQRRPGTSRGI
jgi:multidrug efflux pump subunit AcrB